MDDTTLSSGDIAPETSLADDLAAAASPAPQTDAPVTTTPAATVPGQAADAGATPGPMPFDRHKAILDRAYGERDTVTRERDELRQALEDIRRDPLSTLHELYQYLAAHPQHADRFRQWQQQVVYAQQQARQTPTEEDPFSAFDDQTAGVLRKALDSYKRQLEQQFDQRLKPFEVQAARTQMTHQAHEQARQAFDEARTWEGFDELRGDIHALMSRDARYNLHGAYQKVYREKYLPMRDQKVRNAVLAELQQKRGASTEHPGKASAQTPSRLRDLPTEEVFAELAPQFGL